MLELTHGGLENAPKLLTFIRETHDRYPMISGRLSGYIDKLSSVGTEYFALAETVIDCLWEIARRRGWEADEVYDYYADFVIDFLREQDQFLKSGQYSNAAKGLAEITRDVYHDDEYMRSYMIGLLASYAIFPHHFEQLRFYRDVFEPMLDPRGDCIEFGVGHGLFMSVLLAGSQHRRGFAYDVSDEALAIAKTLLNVRGIAQDRVVIENCDVVSMDLGTRKYAAMTAAGLLEHIDNPHAFLQAVRANLLEDTGRFFVMLPINTAHTDHLILFDNVDDCRKLMTEGGFEPVEERVVPTEDLPNEELARRQVPIVYLGIYRSAGMSTQAL